MNLSMKNHDDMTNSTPIRMARALLESGGDDASNANNTTNTTNTDTSATIFSPSADANNSSTSSTLFSTSFDFGSPFAHESLSPEKKNNKSYGR